jgi:two-component system response regulator WspF
MADAFRLSRIFCRILIEAHLETQSGKIFEALGARAIDVVSTPRLAEISGGAELLDKIRMIRAFVQPLPDRRLVPQNEKHVDLQLSRTQDPLIVIGASAGGPAARGVILASLPRDLGAAVIIVQHIDAQFAPGLALWLKQPVDSTGASHHLRQPHRARHRLSGRHE